MCQKGAKISIISAFMVDVGLKAVVATETVIFGVKQFFNLMVQKIFILLTKYSAK